MNGTWNGPVATTTCLARTSWSAAFAMYWPSLLVNEVTAVPNRTGRRNCAAYVCR